MRTRTWIVALVMLLLIVPLLVSPVAASPAASSCGPGVTYLVRPGDNLFRIALNHGTTMQAIAAANGIYNYTLVYAGSVLSIPCASGYTPPVYTPPVYNPPVYNPPVYTPPVYNPPVYNPPVYVPPAWDSNGILPPVYTTPSYYIPPINVNCNALYGTSPLGGMAYGDQVFYWNPTPGATSYRVNVYSLDYGGALVLSTDVPATRSNALINVGSPAGAGFRFSWEVQAMVSDIAVCTSQRYTMFRAAP